jgi:hypothetical protein
VPRVARRPWIAALALVAGLAAPVVAQTREPLGGWVIDLRGASGALPTGEGWVPPLSTGTAVPGRGFGGEGGVHLLVGPGRHRRLSVGVSGVVLQGRASGTSGPEVTTRLLVGAPHVAMNFGHRLGWSYLSIGTGSAAVRSNAPDVADDSSGSGLVIHYGGGARWFVRRRLAASLDLRFWALTPRPASFARSKAAATTRVVVSAGIAVR